jgi:sporulation protein YlmC with PRC-barrel domain
MAQCGTLKDYRFSNEAEDIRGSSLYGHDDEKLGKIDDVIFDHVTGNIRYIVVDTGGWLSTKKFVVPAERIRASDRHTDDFSADLNKQQIAAFPPYSEAHLESDEQWTDYERRYRAQWKADPVMHRAETDRNITPTTYQMEGNFSSEESSRRTSAMQQRTGTGPGMKSNHAVDRAMEDTGAFETGGFAASTDTVEIQNTAVGIGPRWDTFQDRLRERRKEVIGLPRDKYPKAS